MTSTSFLEKRQRELNVTSTQLMSCIWGARPQLACLARRPPSGLTRLSLRLPRRIHRLGHDTGPSVHMIYETSGESNHSY